MTVDGSAFEFWAESHLCPILGNFSKGEARSIVVMDNASTHMSEKVGDLIRSTGAYLLYTAPYSPDLNPIELGFNIYKKSLMRNSIDFDSDWYQTHLKALNSVNRDICIKEFRQCGVPLSQDVLTSEEKKKLIILLAIELL